MLSLDFYKCVLLDFYPLVFYFPPLIRPDLMEPFCSQDLDFCSSWTHITDRCVIALLYRIQIVFLLISTTEQSRGLRMGFVQHWDFFDTSLELFESLSLNVKV
jgi:hypothetical protein